MDTTPPTPPLTQPQLRRRDKAASRRRSQSFSSTPSSHSSNSSFESSLSFHDDDHHHIHTPISPSTPLQFKGVPFSWEKIPGIPKQIYPSSKHNSDDHESSLITRLLPLPPAGGGYSSKKSSFRDESSPRKSASGSFREDPFLVALVECSKDDHNRREKSKIVAKTTSDRFGFVGLYAAASCKSTCAVSESIVHLPRSRNYDLLRCRSRP